MVKFEGYGKNVMKAHKASPDAWAQMVKQLAFYRLNNRPPVVYESCQTRKFLLGRTEVIRSSSPESKAFCEAMISSSSSDSEREKKFREAVRRHIQYSTWAADGQGVDRHMFGLKKLLKEGEEVPELFKDKVNAKSGHWELSTSQLSSNYLEGWGYGEGKSPSLFFLLPLPLPILRLPLSCTAWISLNFPSLPISISLSSLLTHSARSQTNNQLSKTATVYPIRSTTIT